MKNIVKNYWVIILILLLASGLRLYRLGEYPISLFGDELDAGYNAYSFMLTGKDYNGNFFPVHFESMGDYRPFGFIASLIPSIYVFGLSNFSIRFIPAIFGIFGVLFIYLVVKYSTKNNFWAGFSAFFLAVVPWHIHYSRAGFELTLMIALILLGLLSLIRSKRDARWLWIAVITFTYATYTYNVAKLFSPWILFLGLWIYGNGYSFLKKHWLKLAVLVVMLIPLIFDTFLGSGQNRFNSLSVFNNRNVINEVNISRGHMADQSLWLQRMFQNRWLEALKNMLNNYLSSWDTSFLFFEGQIDNPRHGVPDWGLLYWWMLPLFVLGLFVVWSKRNEKFYKLLLFWLISAPIPAALTVDGGHHASRLFVMVVPMVIISAKGMEYLFTIIAYKKVLFSCLLLITFFNLSYYLEDYYIHYPQRSYRAWGYGMEDAIKYAVKYEADYDQVIVTKSYLHLPMLYYVFYSKYNPNLVHNAFYRSIHEDYPSPTEKLGKIKFMSFLKGDETRPVNSLYIAAYPNDETIGWAELGRLDSPDKNDDNPILLLLRSD